MKSIKVILILSFTIITSTYTKFISEHCLFIENFDKDPNNFDSFGEGLDHYFSYYALNGEKVSGEANPEEELKILFLLKEKPGFIHINRCVYDLPNKQLYIFFEKKEKDLDSKNQDDFKKTLSKKQRLEFYKKVFQILDSLHKLNYIHGELAPWNIMADENYENIALNGFDISTVIGQPSKGNEEKATMSPEKYSNANTISTPEIDIYSLGMTILLIERGNAQALEDIESSFNFKSEQIRYGRMKDKCLGFLKKTFNLKIREIGSFDGLINKMTSNKVINDFSDLIRNMVETKPADRKKIPELIEILDKIIKLYSDQEEKAKNVNNVLI